MPDEKDHGVWTNRPAVQHAVDVDPQHFYNLVAAVITTDQAAKIEADLFPPATQAAIVDDLTSLQSARAVLAANSLDTAETDAKIAALSAVTEQAVPDGG